MASIHKGCSLPFDLIKEHRRKREELRALLWEAGKAIFFKVTFNGAMSKCLLRAEEKSREGCNKKETKATLIMGEAVL